MLESVDQLAIAKEDQCSGLPGSSSIVVSIASWIELK